MSALRALTAVAFVVSCGALAWQAWRALTRGQARVEAPPRGRARDGLLHAFGPGLLPWAKESGRLHPAVYVAGVLYHAGIFASLALTGLAVGGVMWPRGVTAALGPLLVLAVLAGIGLLTRRVATPGLRAVSTPDDYASNVVATLLSAGALVSVAAGAYEPSLLVVAMVLLLYAPIGKIRHCVFFFLARARFGRQLGRRGVLPGTAHGARL